MAPRNVEDRVLEGGLKLKNFIDKDDDVVSIISGMKRPLVVLAFDEAPHLTESMDDRDWSIYWGDSAL